jgi:hypothetical protein
MGFLLRVDRTPVFPDHLVEDTPFPIWVRTTISSAIKHGEIIDEDVHMSMPPTLEATTYRAMYAFGNHLYVSSGEEHSITRDSSIVATFEEECVLAPNYQQPILVKLEYVGWIKEILELNYGVFNTIVFFCDWVKANYTRSNAIITRDEYNFRLDNFNSLIPIFDQSFVFSIHVK